MSTAAPRRAHAVRVARVVAERLAHAEHRAGGREREVSVGELLDVREPRIIDGDAHSGSSSRRFGLALERPDLVSRGWSLEQVQAAMALRELELCLYGEVRSWAVAALRREWNRNTALAAPRWAANSKEAYSSGLAALAAASKNWGDSRRGERAGEPVGVPRFRRRGERDSCAFTTGELVPGARPLRRAQRRLQRTEPRVPPSVSACGGRPSRSPARTARSPRTRCGAAHGPASPAPPAPRR